MLLGVCEKQPGIGFKVCALAPVTDSVKFDWWIVGVSGSTTVVEAPVASAPIETFTEEATTTLDIISSPETPIEIPVPVEIPAEEIISTATTTLDITFSPIENQ